MKYFKATVTSDYKNSSSRKEFKSELFVAKYNATNENETTCYKIIIDREDKRRLALKINEDEMKLLLEQLNSLNK